MLTHPRLLLVLAVLALAVVALQWPRSRAFDYPSMSAAQLAGFGDGPQDDYRLRVHLMGRRRGGPWTSLPSPQRELWATLDFEETLRGEGTGAFRASRRDPAEHATVAEVATAWRTLGVPAMADAVLGDSPDGQIAGLEERIAPLLPAARAARLAFIRREAAALAR